jgi:hypothetical protein
VQTWHAGRHGRTRLGSCVAGLSFLPAFVLGALMRGQVRDDRAQCLAKAPGEARANLCCDACQLNRGQRYSVIHRMIGPTAATGLEHPAITESQR